MKNRRDIAFSVAIAIAMLMLPIGLSAIQIIGITSLEELAHLLLSKIY